MLIKSSASIPSSEITNKRLYMDRRTFMQSATGLATAGAMLGADALVQAAQPALHGKKLENVRASFKHAKSIVKIRFVDQQPLNSWRRQAPQEYGFYANVNPTVDHPRWSQATERRLPGIFKNRKTLLFNGYADQVASLYSGMDLRRNF